MFDLNNIDYENLDYEWCRNNLNEYERCMIVAALRKNNRNKIKSFIREARKSQPKLMQQPCVICGKYESVTNAHHVFPLKYQASRAMKNPDQEIVWLCPNHHSGVHAQISLLERNISKRLEGFEPEEIDKMDKISAMYVRKRCKLDVRN